MHPPDDLTAALPAPRDDEPAALRGDIVDEIADHLTCATRRELISGRVDETEARRRAIHRFGDPARICLQLWWARMRGTIMTQRSLVGMFAATIAMFAAGTFAMWQFHREQQDMIFKYQTSTSSQLREQRGIFEKLLESSQATSAALAKQAEASAEEVREMRKLLDQPNAVSEWSPVEFRFVDPTAAAAPVSGVQLTLLPRKVSESSAMEFKGTSNSEGIIYFEQVHFGNYTANFQTANGEYFREPGQLRVVDILPGQAFKAVLVAPGTPPKSQHARARVKWPEDLQPLSLELGIDRQAFERRVGDTLWRIDHQVTSDRDRRVWINSNGHVRVELFSNAFGNSSLGYSTGGLWPGSVSMQLSSMRNETWKPVDGIQWPDPGCVMSSVTVRVELRDPPKTAGAGPISGSGFQRFLEPAERISALEWTYKVEVGEPTTVWLTPDQKSLDEIRAFIRSIQEHKEIVGEIVTSDEVARRNTAALSAESPSDIVQLD